MGKLDGKVIVVTGASRGIGRAIARACAGEGGEVVLVGRDREGLERVARELQGSGVPWVADVTSPAAVSRLFRRIGRRYGLLDILVNNAGVFTYKPFARTTLKDWRKNIESNLTSVFLTTRRALPLLTRGRAPHLVNILSISSLQGFANCSAYTASKYGALGLTRVLAEELRSRGVRVTAVFPGPTQTGMAREFDFPVDRSRLMRPEDVAEAVLGALVQPFRTTVQDIVLMPSKGSL
jgi:NAD(P)-dependent dehydrogenase (short-subunit alcohol dehydrogenase family)